jgi:hypothetical protein
MSLPRCCLKTLCFVAHMEIPMRKSLIHVLCLPLASVPLIVGAETSPFADKPCKSYSSSVDIAWGTIKADDFGPMKIVFDQRGVRQPGPVPPPGVHPRILITPDDLPDLRQKLKTTRCGRMMWNKILSYSNALRGTYDENADYAKPDFHQGDSGGSHGHIKLLYYKSPGNPFNPATRGYARLIEGDLTSKPGDYWPVLSMEAYRCLIENDAIAGAALGKAVMTAMHIDQASRAQAREAKHQTGPIDRPVSGGAGGQELGWIYDLGYNFFNSEQRAAIHKELADTTWYHDNYGSFNEAERTYSNWATFGYWFVPLLAIEGEPGFNDLKYAGLVRGFRNFFTYGVFPSGAVFEAEAKVQMGADGIIAFARRGQPNLAGHPHLRAYAMDFLPQSIMPNPDFVERSSSFPPGGFIRYDRLGGAGNILGVDAVGLKYLFPKEPVVDWVYRVAVGDNYERLPSGDNPGYWNQLLIAAMLPADYDPANSDPGKLGLPLTYVAGERALVITRSGWDKDALMMDLHVRGVNGGHPYADRNTILFTGKGRIWSGLNQWLPDNDQQSLVSIDDWSQDALTPARLVSVTDRPLATFAVGDASYCWDWHMVRIDSNPVTHRPYTPADLGDGKSPAPNGGTWERHSINDFAFIKVPTPGFDDPLYLQKSWIGLPGVITPVMRKKNESVIKAYRTIGIIRGTHPYALVVDDVQADKTPHTYDWRMLMEKDLTIGTTEPAARSPGSMCDVTLIAKEMHVSSPDKIAADSVKFSANDPKLLVRVLRCDQSDPQLKLEPTMAESRKKDNTLFSLKGARNNKLIQISFPLD